MASTYLHRTLGSTVTVQKITISCWVKKNALTTTQRIFSHMISGFSQYFYFRFDNEDTLGFAANASGSSDINYKTNRKFRDTSSWYHLVARIDTTAAGGNRVKIYVNGVQETSFAASTEPDQNATFEIGTTSDPMSIGALYGNGYGINSGSSSEHFDGSISHFHFCDGYAYDASYFGETDTTTGEWRAKTSPSVTYGTNGFFIFKDGNGITDQSGEGNNFTLGGGTLTNLQDNPDNVFATWNPLVNPWASTTTWTYGNTRGYNSDSSKGSLVTTLGATSGKYYMEIKQENSNSVWIGICGDGFVSDNVLNRYSGSTQDATTGLLIKYSDGTRAVNNSDSNNIFATTGQGDITGIAIDLDAATRTVTFYKNGVADNAGAQNLPTNMQTGAIFGCAIVHGGAAVNLNAGNGYFANNAISSEGTNASEIGKFEYDVPSGYTALSTKGLNL